MCLYGERADIHILRAFFFPFRLVKYPQMECGQRILKELEQIKKSKAIKHILHLN